MTRIVVAGGFVLATVLVPLVTLPAAPVQPKPADAGNPQFEALIDRYLAEIRGIGGSRPPNDGSAAWFEREREAVDRLITELRQIDRSTLTFDQDVDYRYLEGLLEVRRYDAQHIRRWQQDPRQYLSIEPIILPRGGLLHDEMRPIEDRADEILAVLRQAPRRLDNGRRNLTTFVELWLEPSRGYVDAVIEILERDIPAFAARIPSRRDGLLAESRKTLQAYRDFRRFLDTEWQTRPRGDWRIGAEAYNFHLRHGHMIDELDADGLYQWGRREYAEQLDVLERTARRVDATRTWQQIERDLQDDHPSAESMIYEYLKTVKRTRDWVVQHDLMTMPFDKQNGAIALAMPVVYGKLATFGYGGAPVGRNIDLPGAVMLVPFDPRWSPARQKEFLRGHNLALIHTMMTHEVYPGHGLVQQYLNHNPRKLRTYESSYANQAWCYYVEWVLTPEFGFYPADKHDVYVVAMERNKLWRYARAIYDPGIHTGRMSFDEAVQLLHDGVIFSERSAFNEVEQVTRGVGGSGAVPTWGYHEILKLRDDYFARMLAQGRTGTLKDFHDRVLKIGMVPVKLIRETLFHQLDQERRRTSSDHLEGGGSSRAR